VSWPPAHDEMPSMWQEGERVMGFDALRRSSRRHYIRSLSCCAMAKGGIIECRPASSDVSPLDLRSDRPKVRAKPNKITGAKASGQRRLPMRKCWAARVAQFGLGDPCLINDYDKQQNAVSKMQR
jgi:hypothetical protein